LIQRKWFTSPAGFRADLKPISGASRSVKQIAITDTTNPEVAIRKKDNNGVIGE
jgi:hypothetical protein